jgi:hypothetical protein
MTDTTRDMDLGALTMANATCSPPGVSSIIRRRHGDG